MAIGKRESGIRVIERGGVPASSGVALRAGREWESLGVRVRRIIGLLPGSEVATGIAAIVVLYRQIVIVIDMALSAGNGGMRAI